MTFRGTAGNEPLTGRAKYLTVVRAAIGLGGVAVSVLGTLAAAAGAQQSPSAFTLAQAEAGATEYVENCAGCHGDDLAGKTNGPSLKGTAFMSIWGARRTKDLYQYISTAMPPGNAGSLSADTSADLVAYILAYNSAKPGNLPFESGTDIKVSAIATGERPARLPQPAGNEPMAGRRSKPTSRHGLTVAGTIKNYLPVTDDDAGPSAGWRLADVSPQLPGLELQSAQPDQHRQCERAPARNGPGR